MLGRIGGNSTMNVSATDEIQEVSRPIVSLMGKLEKAQEKLTPGTWQYTMVQDNLSALRCALDLMHKETSGTSTFTQGDLQEALRSLLVLISKTDTAKSRRSPGTSQHTLLENRLKALRLAEERTRAELEKKGRFAYRNGDEPRSMLEPVSPEE